jgi:hypothetical protein
VAAVSGRAEPVLSMVELAVGEGWATVDVGLADFIMLLQVLFRWSTAPSRHVSQLCVLPPMVAWKVAVV